ncbi:MAG TPA: hypothetical protein VFD58_12530 [Blastocatellia bacterium]|nr:hypothetical protein [Blastocatellia bacterium]
MITAGPVTDFQLVARLCRVVPLPAFESEARAGAGEAFALAREQAAAGGLGELIEIVYLKKDAPLLVAGARLDTLVQ